MRKLFAEIYRRNHVLAVVGWFHVALLAVALGVACFDARSVMGINPWFKPMKFMGSIAIFLWSLGWLMAYLPGPRWLLRSISWGVSLVWITEISCISLQSARGTTSSFNLSTPFNTFVYTMMGIMAMVSILYVTCVLVLFFVRKVDLAPAYLWGIRLGLLVFLFGNFQGLMMHYNLAHTVGLADGGPGLPVVNWSTRAGDLRIAHFFGLHALQIFPLFGFFISRWKKAGSYRRQIAYVAGFALVYVGTMGVLLVQAMIGQPLIVG